MLEPRISLFKGPHFWNQIPNLFFMAFLNINDFLTLCLFYFLVFPFRLVQLNLKRLILQFSHLFLSLQCFSSSDFLIHCVLDFSYLILMSLLCCIFLSLFHLKDVLNSLILLNHLVHLFIAFEIIYPAFLHCVSQSIVCLATFTICAL